MIRFILVILSLLLFLSCQTLHPPIEDYSLARAALEAARSVQAVRYSPGFWHQGDEAYRKARIFYKNQDYESAKIEFVKARIAFEKAENSARLLRQKNGDFL